MKWRACSVERRLSPRKAGAEFRRFTAFLNAEVMPICSSAYRRKR